MTLLHVTQINPTRFHFIGIMELIICVVRKLKIILKNRNIEKKEKNLKF